MTVVRVYEGKELNPGSLIEALGLASGEIEAATKHAEGYVSIAYATTPSVALEQRMEAELRKRGVLTGKKP